MAASDLKSVAWLGVVFLSSNKVGSWYVMHVTTTYVAVTVRYESLF